MDWTLFGVWDYCSFVVLMRQNGGIIYYFLCEGLGGASPSPDPSPSI